MERKHSRDRKQQLKPGGGGGPAQTPMREVPGRSGKFWDGGRIPASYYLLHLVAESWGKTRENMPRKWRLQRRCKEHFSGERNGARPAPANGSPCSKGAHTMHDVPAGEKGGSRGPGGRSQGAAPEWPAKSRRFSRPYAVIFVPICSYVRIAAGNAAPAVSPGPVGPHHRAAEGDLGR